LHLRILNTIYYFSRGLKKLFINFNPLWNETFLFFSFQESQPLYDDIGEDAGSKITKEIDPGKFGDMKI